eukprot:6789012-Pyramimonas_sp.AAC.2
MPACARVRVQMLGLWTPGLPLPFLTPPAPAGCSRVYLRAPGASEIEAQSRLSLSMFANVIGMFLDAFGPSRSSAGLRGTLGDHR